MSYKIKKYISLFVAAAVLFMLTLPVLADSPSDTAGHWAADAVNRWVDSGLISGYPDGSFKPDQAISRGEFVVLVDRIFKFTGKSASKFKDVPEGRYYTEAVYKAAASGIVSGDGNGSFRPDSPISREEAAVVIARAFALKAKDKNTAAKFSDASGISAWSREAISALAEKSYISGRPGNIFDPRASVTRAEAVVMLDNTTGVIKSSPGTYTGDVAGNLTVNSPSVILENMTIGGDLLLSDGIGAGEVVMNGVRVLGRIVAKGGGENSIVLNNSSAGSLLVIKQDGKLRVVAKGSSEIPVVQMASGGRLEEEGVTGGGFGRVEVVEIGPGGIVSLDGDFESVSLAVAGVSLNIESGTIGVLEVGAAAAGAVINTAEGVTITKFTADAPVKVTGKGIIKTAVVNVNGVTMETTPETLIAPAGVTVTAGGKTIEGTGGTQGGSSPASGGGGSSGGNTPADTVTSVSLVKSDGSLISSTNSGSEFVIDISDKTGILTGVKISSTPAADKLVAEDVGNPVNGLNGEFPFSGNGSLIEAVTGIDIHGDIHISTIKSFLSGSITNRLKVYHGNSLIKEITLTIKISDDDNGVSSSDRLFSFYTVTADGTTGKITAKLKNGKENERIFSGTGFYQLLKDMITIPSGYSYTGMAIGVDEAGYTDFTRDDLQILTNLKAKTGAAGVNLITLGELKDKKITVKVKAAKGSAEKEVTVLFK